MIHPVPDLSTTAKHRRLLLLLLVTCQPLLADHYLDQLNAEADKVDLRETEAVLEQGADNSRPTRNSSSAEIVSKRAAFETLLKDSHPGIYLFYEKLSARSKEEVFEGHSNGLPIADLEKMILERQQHEQH